MFTVLTNDTLQQNMSPGLPSLAGKRVLILGLARQGLALARFCARAGAIVTVSDLSPADKLGAELDALAPLRAAGLVTTALGGHPLALLDACDLVCLSGGVPPQSPIVQAAIHRGIALSNDSLMTFQMARQLGLGPLIGITGSSGKTTTTTLVGQMLAAAGRTVHVGGNIGAPLLDRLDAIQPGEPIVLELSSFQLELFDPALAWGAVAGIGPDVAAILNLTPNHLDRHPSMAAYVAAKLNLLRCLPPGAAVVLSADDPATAELATAAGALDAADGPPTPAAWALGPLLAAVGAQLRQTGARCIPFSRTRHLAQGAWLADDALLLDGTPFVRTAEIRLRGAHNQSNLLAAAAISGAALGSAAGAAHDGLHDVAAHFAGVPHRLEIVREAGGVTWVNDSIATSPERALAGLRSFDPAAQTIILLAGGKDKNLPWEEFAEEALRRVSFLIGFGHAGAMIVETVRRHAAGRPGAAPGTAVVHRLDEAVELAARSASPGTVVLLSPGGTSYDAYKDFEARGQHFRALVEQYGHLSSGSETPIEPTAHATPAAPVDQHHRQDSIR